MSIDDYLVFSPAVEAARAAGRPLVALESTLIAHGLPYPDNLESARACEAIIRAAGAEPATIALMNARIRIGLDDAQLEALATGSDIAKVSRRDLPALLASGAMGATTVAGTMICAAAAGIRIFATGGIGGVHAGAAETFDISADLGELARTSVAVVCAGAKSILDLAKTFQILETLGVPVVVHGADEIPAFYCRESGIAAPLRLDTANEIADLLRVKWALGLDGGVVVANPISEDQALALSELEAVISKAQRDADRAAIHGKAVTPFLLARIAELSGGRSLAANKALIKANAHLAAEIAIALQSVTDT